MAGLKMFSTMPEGRRRPNTSFAITFAFLISLLILSALPGCQSPLSAPSPSSGPIRVGTSGDYAPFSQSSTDAPRATYEPTGFAVDLARAYASHTGQGIEFVPFQWPELLHDLSAGRFDFALSGVTVRPDRSIAGRFSHPVTVSGAVVLVRETGSLERPEDLRREGLVLAVNAGGHLERTARALFPAAKIEAVPANHLVLDALDRSEVDAVVTDSLEAPIWLARRGGLRAIGPLTRDRKAAWFSTSRANEAERFDDWLLAAEASGELESLRALHGLPPDRTAEPIAALLARLDERLSLMIDVAKAKAILGSAIEDLPREERVLDAAVAGIRRAAQRAGSSPPEDQAVRRLYRAQIEAAKTIQRRWTREQSPLVTDERNPETARRALDEEIRPALIYLGDRLADLLVRVLDQNVAAPTREDLRQALDRHALPEEDLDALTKALEGLLTN